MCTAGTPSISKSFFKLHLNLYALQVYGIYMHVRRALFSRLLYARLLYAHALYAHLLYSRALYARILYTRALYTHVMYARALYSHVLYACALYARVLYVTYMHVYCRVDEDSSNKKVQIDGDEEVASVDLHSDKYTNNLLMLLQFSIVWATGIYVVGTYNNK